MLSNFAYLLTSKSVTLYILYTLHVMLGTSLVFTALYTYGVHSSKAMARAAKLEASLQVGSVNGPGMMAMGSTVGNGSAVEFEEDMDEITGMDIAIGGLDGLGNGLNGMRKVKSMIGLSTGRGGWENGSMGYGGNGNEGGVKFREIYYEGSREYVKEGVGMDVSGLGGKGMALEIS